MRKKHKQINFYKHILLYICTLSQNYREKRKVLKINNSKTQLVFTIFIYYKKRWYLQNLKFFKHKKIKYIFFYNQYYYNKFKLANRFRFKCLKIFICKLLLLFLNSIPWWIACYILVNKVKMFLILLYQILKFCVKVRTSLFYKCIYNIFF